MISQMVSLTDVSVASNCFHEIAFSIVLFTVWEKALFKHVQSTNFEHVLG